MHFSPCIFIRIGTLIRQPRVYVSIRSPLIILRYTRLGRLGPACPISDNNPGHEYEWLTLQSTNIVQTRIDRQTKNAKTGGMGTHFSKFLDESSVSEEFFLPVPCIKKERTVQ